MLPSIGSFRVAGAQYSSQLSPCQHLLEDAVFDLRQVYMALAYRFYPVNKGNLDTRQVLPIVYQAMCSMRSPSIIRTTPYS